MEEDHAPQQPLHLRFGLNPLPPGVETAFGARWVIDSFPGDFRVYQVGDRTDLVGPPDRAQALIDYLNEHVGTRDQDRAKELLDTLELGSGMHHEVVLFEDDAVIVRGNPKRSFGYLYVHAYFKDDEA